MNRVGGTVVLVARAQGEGDCFKGLLDGFAVEVGGDWTLGERRIDGDPNSIEALELGRSLTERCILEYELADRPADVSPYRDSRHLRGYPARAERAAFTAHELKSRTGG